MSVNQADLFGEESWEGLQGNQAGVDEAGRGPIFGSVVAAAVILPADCNLPLIDSKKLSEKKRNELEIAIKEQALAYAVVSLDAAEVDRLNILQASLEAMRQAVMQLDKPFERVLVDGNRCPQNLSNCIPIVKGDDKVAEISAASILAKVERDRQMYEADKVYPAYGFAKHKGYPTKAHLELIKTLGLIPGYRESFKPVAELLHN